MYTPLNQYHVVMEVAPRFWQHPETLRDIYVRRRPARGAAVRVQPVRAAHDDARRQPSGSVPRGDALVQPRPGVALGDAVEAIEAAAQELGCPASIHGSFQGAAQAFQASLGSEPVPHPGRAADRLHRARHALRELHPPDHDPLDLAVRRRGRDAGAAALPDRIERMALIGIILLIGIVKKNAIMMIDFALEAERKEGQDRRKRSTRPACCASGRS